MSAGRLFVVIFASALMGGLMALGGFIWWDSLQAPSGQSVTGTEHLASTDPTTAQGRLANMPQSRLPEAIAGTMPNVLALPEGGDPEERIVTAVYERAAPSVVHIHKTSTFPTVFGNQTDRNSGSGVIYNSAGFILTNSHVVSSSSNSRTEYTVTLQDGTDYAAILQAVDKDTDLAVLKLTEPPPNLPVADLGNSDAMRVGQRAIVIGNPYGFDSSISVGVVSALNRAVVADHQRFEGMIQTDAAVNPGNSGGPLLNSVGQVVGINTIIYTQSGGSHGLGFAIPINDAREVVEDLLTYGKVRRPWLGMQGMLPLGPSLAKYLGLGVNSGVLIQHVVPDGPGAKAGLRGGTEPIGFGNGQYILTGGDVLLSIDGQRVYSGNDVGTMIRRMEVGRVVTLEIWRDNALMEVKVILEVSP